MIYFVYNIGLVLYFFLKIPQFLYQFFTKGKYRNLYTRCGNLPEKIKRKLKKGKWILLHAVSVGEVNAALAVLKKLKKNYPDYRVLVTTITETGYENALKKMKLADAIYYLPLDFPWFVKRFLNAIQNLKLIILMETEIWPNLIKVAHENHIPVIIINGRISDKSYPYYRKVNFLLCDIFKMIYRVCARTNLDAIRFKNIGMSSKRIKVTGNVKYDSLTCAFSKNKANELDDKLHLKTRKVVLFASTHEKEEEIAVKIYLNLKSSIPDLFFIIAPRHINRVNEISKILQKYKVPFIRYTQHREADSSIQILLVDTIGDMQIFYYLSKIVFVGGSIANYGGHNILEPCVFKKPVLFGRYMQNFRFEEEVLKKSGGIQVKDEKDLELTLSRLLLNEDLAMKVGEEVYNKVIELKGATDRIIKEIEKLL